MHGLNSPSAAHTQFASCVEFTPLIASIRGIDGVEIKRLVDRVDVSPIIATHAVACCS